MKKLLLMMVMVAVMIFSITATSYATEVFQLEHGIAFEMSMSDVLAYSIQDLHRGSNTELVCQTPVFGVDATMMLDFGKLDALAKICYQIDTENKSAAECIADYEDVSQGLTRRYRTSTANGNMWKTRNDADRYGSNFEAALEDRKMAIVEIWSFTDVYIEHVISNSDSGIQHFLNYRSLELDPEIDRIRAMYGGY